MRGLRLAISQIELVMCTVFVALILSTAMHSFGIVMQTRTSNGDSLQAEMLINMMADEIASNSYADPDQTPKFGKEGKEGGGGTRTKWDDVDDYKNWSSAPPTDKEGNTIAGTTGLTREVTVRLAPVADPTANASFDEGLKRVEIVISRAGASIARRRILIGDN